MKWKSLSVLWVVLAAVLSGCITLSDVSPDTDETIVLSPGDVQAFHVTAETGANEDIYWGITNTNDDSELDEWYKLTSPHTETTEYHPDTESPGSYQVKFTCHEYVKFGDYSVIINTATKTWDMVVKGIEVLPAKEMSASVGSSQTYAATAYPTGTYAYTWFLDDVQVGAEQEYTFTPTAAQRGLHTLKVTATGAGGDLTYSCRIIVPFAQAVSSTAPFFVCDDGGLIISKPIDDSSTSAGKSSLYKLDSQGQLLWDVTCGDDGRTVIQSIHTATDGGIIAAGYSSSTAVGDTTNSGENDWYIVKANSAGTIVWQILLGSTGSDYMDSIIPTSDGGFLALGMYGTSPRCTWLVKLDASGALVWERTFTDKTGFTAMAVVESGGYYILAGTFGATDAPRGYIDKINPVDGSTIWEVTYDADGNTPTYLTSITPGVDGGYVVAGYIRTSVTDTFACAAKLSETGVVEWQHVYTDAPGDTEIIMSDPNIPGYVLGGDFTTDIIHAAYAGTSYRCATVLTLDSDGFLSRLTVLAYSYFFKDMQPMDDSTYMMSLRLNSSDAETIFFPLDISVE